jgi:hypothetical protein
MPLRYFRFYLSGYHHYYGHIRLPQQQWTSPVLLGPPTFMRYLFDARNIILLRVSINVHIAVASIDITGFIISGSLTDTNSVTEPN